MSMTKSHDVQPDSWIPSVEVVWTTRSHSSLSLFCSIAPCEPTYRRGAPVSQCRDNTAPSRDYPALCEAQDSTGPKDPNQKKLGEKSLFYCDFSDGTVCGLKLVQGPDTAFLVHLFQYLSFKVAASQYVAIELPDIQSAGPWCLTYETRQGAADAKDPAKSEFLEWITQGNIEDKSVLKSESLAWTQKKTGGAGNSNPAKIRLTFDVPAGAGQQYLEIKSISVTPGSCL